MTQVNQQVSVFAAWGMCVERRLDVRVLDVVQRPHGGRALPRGNPTIQLSWARNDPLTKPAKAADIICVSALLVEQRKSPRRRSKIPQGIRICTDAEPGGARTLAAKLVDASETGVGVDTYVPLRVGSTVFVEGKLRHTSYSLALKGQARVMHARSLGDGVYRIGLVFEKVAYRRPS